MYRLMDNSFSFVSKVHDAAVENVSQIYIYVNSPQRLFSEFLGEWEKTWWPRASNNLINQSVSDRLKSTSGSAIVGTVLFTPFLLLSPPSLVVLHTRTDPGVFPNPLTDGSGQVYSRPRHRRESAKKAKSFIRQWQSEHGGLHGGIIMRNEEKSGFDEKSPYIALRIVERETQRDRVP